MNPEDLPWWGWLIGSAAFLVLAVVCGMLKEWDENRLFGYLSMVFGAGAVVVGMITVFTFIKWIWEA